MLFVAHTGFETVHNLQDLKSGSLVGRTLRIHFWRVPYSDIPKELDGRRAWFWKNWSAVNNWIKEQESW